jgi:hypothetical protein
MDTLLKAKRLTFLIDKTHSANRSLRFVFFGTAALASVLLIATVVLSVRSTSLADSNRSLSAKTAGLEAELGRVRKQTEALEAKIENERGELRGALDSSKKEIENLRFELEKARLGVDAVREEKTYLEDILIHKTKDIEKLKTAVSTNPLTQELKTREEDIARLRDQNRLLAGKLEKLYKTTLDRLSAIALAKSTLEETLADAKRLIDEEWNAVDLGLINVDRSVSATNAAAPSANQAAPSAESRRAARKEGKVKAVNDAHGFIVVDLGKVDNLTENSVLQIKKGGEWVATLTVLEVRDVMAACNVKNAVPGYKIRVDDPVFIQQSSA